MKLHKGVTVAIPLTDASERFMKALDLCVLSLKRQTVPRNLYDIVISFVWNTGQRGDICKTGRMARLAQFCLDHNVVLVPFAHKLGEYPPSLSRNVGGRWGRREIMTFVDADAVIHPDALKKTMEVFDDSPDSKVAVLIKTRMTPWPTGSEVYKRALASGASFQQTAQAGPLAGGTGCCTFVRQEDYERLGGLDERFLGYGATDIDFTERLTIDGFELVDLTAETGIVNMHQAHPRPHQDVDYKKVPSRVRTRKIMDASLKAREVVRNAKGWAGLR